jgi:acyl-CoA hydrolase
MTTENKLVICQVMMPDQANVAGNVHGGEIMKMMDTAAGAVAIKYARCNVVTARVDELQFLRPVLVGTLVTCTAVIAYVGNTTMEVVVTTEIEDLESDAEPEIALTGYFTMVALDKTGKPKKLKPFIPKTEEAIKLNAEAEARRELYKLRLKN